MFDFDTHFKKIKSPDKEMIVRGEKFVLPADLPAGFGLATEGLGEGEQIPVEIYVNMLAALFGKEKLEEWIRAQGAEAFSREEMWALLNSVFELYRPENAVVEDPDDPKV